jgi:hypothetical protein
MASGSKPFFNEGQWPLPETRNIMSDPVYSPTLLESFSLGVGKAHRNVVYSHYEYRNFRRMQGTSDSGRVFP